MGHRTRCVPISILTSHHARGVGIVGCGTVLRFNFDRKFYEPFWNNGVPGAERFCHLVFSLSGVRYSVMTNIFPLRKRSTGARNDYSNQFRSALRIDPLLSVDVRATSAILSSSGYEVTTAGARQYLHDWCDIIKPEYAMASTQPDPFSLKEDTFRFSRTFYKYSRHWNEHEVPVVLLKSYRPT